MLISVLEVVKIGMGPSSWHTMSPMVVASEFRDPETMVVQAQPL
ncbi:MAG: serine dehydratase beta chain [Thiogranum sp.]